MDDPENTQHDCEQWGDGLEQIFIGMLYADSLSGALRVGNITSRDHTLYAQRFTALGIRVFDDGQIRVQVQRLKQMLHLFTNFMNQTSTSWDFLTKTTIANDEQWENVLKVTIYFSTFVCTI